MYVLRTCWYGIDTGRDLSSYLVVFGGLGDARRSYTEVLFGIPGAKSSYFIVFVRRNYVLGDRHGQARPGAARHGQASIFGGCFHRALLALLVEGSLFTHADRRSADIIYYI